MDALSLYIITMILFAAIAGLFFFSVYIFKRSTDLNPLHESIEQLKIEKEQLQQEIGTASASLANLQNDIKKLRQELANAEQIIARAQSVKEELKKNEGLLADRKAENQNLNSEIKTLTDKKNILENQAGEQQIHLKQIQANITQLDQNFKKLSDECEQLENKNQRLKAIVSELPQKQLEYDKLKQNLEELNLQYAKLKAEISVFEAQKNAKDDIIKGLEQNIDSKKNELAKIQKEIEKEKADRGRHLDELDHEISEKKRQLAKIEQAHMKEVARLQGLVNTLKINYDELSERTGINAQKFCWNDLDRPIFTQTEYAKILPKNEELAWLDEFQNNMRECGIVFNERVVKAFHTGLKISDYSPIVVLSGISGTGKSLLPQLYATASGMNFLQLAVQPRWDSPQDMLGFYNYMEKRYKATDLARLLWQYDFFNNPSVKDQYYDFKNLPVNLVLLDEMNIARIEYYFSDMLSKLEVRRTVVPNDDINRRAAEIEIESGASSKNASPRRLYIGKNTLFVGTMNEDESTQSLSDKVVDRSNVLRFGKPQNLTADPQSELFMQRYSDINQHSYRSYGRWEEWLQKNNVVRSFEGVLRPILDQLNDALAMVQRPFGYRVDQSILHYVANYPGAVADKGNPEFSHAVEDQIEMKILPKLNGIEKDSSVASNALKKISETISDVEVNGEHDLQNAFESSLQDPSSIFFKWRGISR